MVPEIHLTLSKTNLARVDWALDCWQKDNQMVWVYCTACPILTAIGMRKAAKYIHSVTATACINQRRWFLYPFGPVWVHVWSINSIRQKVPHLQFHYISLPSPAQTTKTALACICWQIGLLAVGETLVSTQWDCIVHPPFWTNKIRVKMKSIITADIFISGLPYLITNFFQGFLEEFILWASLSMLLRMCCLVTYTLLPEGRGCVIAVSLIAAHCLSSFLVLCLFQ